MQHAWVLRPRNVLCPVQLLHPGFLLSSRLLRSSLLLHAFGLLHTGCLLHTDATEGRMRPPMNIQPSTDAIWARLSTELRQFIRRRVWTIMLPTICCKRRSC